MFSSLKRLSRVLASQSVVSQVTQGVREPASRSAICLAVRLRHADAMPYKRSPEDLYDLMNSFYSSIASAILSTNGDVENFCGGTI